MVNVKPKNLLPAYLGRDEKKIVKLAKEAEGENGFELLVDEEKFNSSSCCVEFMNFWCIFRRKFIF